MRCLKLEEDHPSYRKAELNTEIRVYTKMREGTLTPLLTTIVCQNKTHT